jgi:hypothetical protein
MLLRNFLVEGTSLDLGKIQYGLGDILLAKID